MIALLEGNEQPVFMARSRGRGPGTAAPRVRRQCLSEGSDRARGGKDQPEAGSGRAGEAVSTSPGMLRVTS